MNKKPIGLQIVEGMQLADRPSDYWATSPVRFDELEKLKSIMQRNDQTSYDHTMAVLDLLKNKNRVILLAALFHDIGKGYINPVDDPSLPRFPCHAIESVTVIDHLFPLWEIPREIHDQVSRIVETHMIDISHMTAPKTVRKFIAKVGMENIPYWFQLRIADSQSYHKARDYHDNLIQPFYRLVMSYVDNIPGEEEVDKRGGDSAIQIEGGDS